MKLALTDKIAQEKVELTAVFDDIEADFDAEATEMKAQFDEYTTLNEDVLS